MLAKGHHFPCVTLVGIVNADFGLFSADPRGSEKMAQIITQVAGRAGRGKKPGKVIIQTYCPDHPHIERLTNGSYEDFALELLKERKLIQSPPFSYQARIQSESVKSVFSRDFLIDIWKKTEERNLLFPNIKKIGPLPSK
jgi:primosomal protein N' (replication factor Y)